MAHVAADPTSTEPASPASSQLIATATVPGGAELRLMQRGSEFTIQLGQTELMSTRASASEEALATMACARLAGRRAPDLLIGGYGMGFTLRAALAVLGPDATVTLAELAEEIIEWAHGPMRQLTARCLDDPRVMLVMDDVAMLIDAARSGYDAILLDVDNGPEGITRRDNDDLYSAHGLAAVRRALKPGGVLAVWSCAPDAGFTRRLAGAGLLVNQVTVRARPGKRGARHTIWLAQRPNRDARVTVGS